MDSQLLQEFKAFLENTVESGPGIPFEDIRKYAADCGFTGQEQVQESSWYSRFSESQKTSLASICELLFQIAVLHYRKEECSNVLELLQIAMPVVTASENVQKQIQLINLQALTMMKQGDVRQALNNYDKALTLAREHKIADEEARTLFNIGTVLETNDSDECTHYLEQASSILQTTGNDFGLSFCRNAFASYYRKRGMPEKALTCSHDALKLIKDGGSADERGRFLRNLALTEIDLKMFENAEEHIKQALEITEPEQSSVYAELVSVLAQILLKNGEPSRAEILLDSLENSIENSAVEAKIEYYRTRHNLFKQKGLADLSLEAFEKSVELRKKHWEENRQRLIDIAFEESRIQREKMERELLAETNLQLVRTNRQLQEALKKADELTGLLPVCSNCGKNRDDQDYLKRLKDFMLENSQVQSAECLCGDCRNTEAEGVKEVE